MWTNATRLWGTHVNQRCTICHSNTWIRFCEKLWQNLNFRWEHRPPEKSIQYYQCQKRIKAMHRIQIELSLNASSFRSSCAVMSSSFRASFIGKMSKASEIVNWKLTGRILFWSFAFFFFNTFLLCALFGIVIVYPCWGVRFCDDKRIEKKHTHTHTLFPSDDYRICAPRIGNANNLVNSVPWY